MESAGGLMALDREVVVIGAGVAGLSRAEFLDALGRFCVSPFQYGADEIVEEADRA